MDPVCLFIVYSLRLTFGIPYIHCLPRTLFKSSQLDVEYMHLLLEFHNHKIYSSFDLVIGLHRVYTLSSIT